VLFTTILAALAVLSLLLLAWQVIVGSAFKLHKPPPVARSASGITFLKPLKGCDDTTAESLRSWFVQDYAGPIQILFAVASESDPVCAIVRKLLEEFPTVDARLVLCVPLEHPNAKIVKLLQLEEHAKHEILVISDADVRVPPQLARELVTVLQDLRIGLANCFYRLANPSGLAMHLEAIGVNADFWSQVLQSRSLKPLQFALGAVMATRRSNLAQIGGFAGLADCLADDYQLGNRIASHGHRIELSSLVVDCWSHAMTAKEVWKHQLRWARTIRVCQPLPYFFSILSNPVAWPLACLLSMPNQTTGELLAVAIALRVLATYYLQLRIGAPARNSWLAPVKDVFQLLVWTGAFAGNSIEWRGRRMKLRADGTLVEGPNPKSKIQNPKETRTLDKH